MQSFSQHSEPLTSTSANNTLAEPLRNTYNSNTTNNGSNHDKNKNANNSNDKNSNDKNTTTTTTNNNNDNNGNNGNDNNDSNKKNDTVLQNVVDETYKKGYYMWGWTEEEKYTRYCMELSVPMIAVCGPDPVRLSEIGKRVCRWPHLYYRPLYISDEIELNRYNFSAAIPHVVLPLLIPVVTHLLVGKVVAAVLAVISLFYCFFRRNVYVVDEVVMAGRGAAAILETLRAIEKKRKVVLLCSSEFLQEQLPRVRASRLRLPLRPLNSLQRDIAQLLHDNAPSTDTINALQKKFPHRSAHSMSPWLLATPEIKQLLESNHTAVEWSKLPDVIEFIAKLELGVMMGNHLTPAFEQYLDALLGILDGSSAPTSHWQAFLPRGPPESRRQVDASLQRLEEVLGDHLADFRRSAPLRH